jgi:hypothetical protein
MMKKTENKIQSRIAQAVVEALETKVLIKLYHFSQQCFPWILWKWMPFQFWWMYRSFKQFHFVNDL